MSALKIFEHRIQKDFNHRLKQIDGAGKNMTTLQAKAALNFLNTAYVGAATVVRGELTWDSKGNETYHHPFWVAACEGDIVELAPVEYAVVSEDGA